MSTARASAPPGLDHDPGRPALLVEDREVTHGDLDALVDSLAGRLAGAVSAGQRVGVVAPNSPALVAGIFAAWRLGAVALPINARWRAYELEHLLRDADVSALISVESYRGFDFGAILAAARPVTDGLRRCVLVDQAGEVRSVVSWKGGEPAVPLGPEIGLLLYTSGTDGAPKGTLLTHQSQWDGARALNSVLGTTPDDVALLVVPISHAFGLACYLAAYAAGARVVLVDSTFTAGPMVEAIRRHRVTILHGSPSLFATLLRSAAGGRGASLTGFVAGSACPAHVLERLDEIGLRILNLYGMTEIGAATCCRPDDPPRVRYTTVGRPLPGYAFRVDGGGGTGDILVSGPSVTPGYFRQPSQTSAAFVGPWFRTGDIGELDEDGNLRLSGRAKDLIHVAGFNVFPAEVEALLLTHPDVMQAAVLGAPHETMGEVPQAFVVPRPGATLSPPALLQFARPRIAGYKLPYTIHVLGEMPLLSSGKPDRAALARSVSRTGGRP